MKKRSKQSGFTIIEILVVIGIIAVIGTTGIASFSTFSRQEKLTTEIKKLADVLETTKAKAVSGDGDAQCNYFGDYHPKAYKVTMQLVNGVVQYQVNIRCADDYNSGGDLYTDNPLTYNMDPSISIDTTVTPLPYVIEFEAKTGFLPTSAMIKMSSSPKVKCIEISRSGILNEKKDADCNNNTLT